MSIPVLGAAVWYSCIKMYSKQLKEGGIYDYAKKNARFKRDMDMLKKFMVNRQDYLIETKRNESGSVNIQKIVDKWLFN